MMRNWRTLWFQRSRLSSVRTLPERSDVRGSGREAELREDGLQTGSLHRARFGSERGNPRISVSRHRKLSTASSPSSYKVWTADEEEEVDHYGYVLPGSPGTPEREDAADVETLTPVLAVRSKQVSEDCEGNVAEQSHSAEKHQIPVGTERATTVMEGQEEAAQGKGRYEYMDITHSDSTEEEESTWKRRGSQTSAKSAAEMEETDQILEVLKNEHKEEEEDHKYHNTNKQPTHQGDLSNMVMPRPDVLTAGGEKVEYEEMRRFGVVPGGWEQADYQNLPVKGGAVSEEMGTGRCAGIGGYIK
ncbi:hypothetical protein INR49_009197, partial [Caranx melampygus]